MLQQPFSVKGRIRRLEEGLTPFVYFLIKVAGQIVAALIDIPLLLIVAYLASGTGQILQDMKRSHELGRSGRFPLVPFYTLLLLFRGGKPGVDEYGPNPQPVSVLRHDAALLDSDYV